jgi:hypothetical protein
MRVIETMPRLHFPSEFPLAKNPSRMPDAVSAAHGLLLAPD